MAIAKKVTLATKSESALKSETATRRKSSTISKTAVAKKNEGTVSGTTNTQVRKTKSPSVRNKAPQNQIKTVEKITAVKSPKTVEAKMERDSFTMPKDEYAQLAVLKKRLSVLGQSVKKSELLRAGIKSLSEMTDTKLKSSLAALPVIKTGRPKKKK